MVDISAERLDAVFHALGDATRRAMLADLALGDRTVGQLADPFAISLAAAWLASGDNRVPASDGLGSEMMFMTQV